MSSNILAVIKIFDIIFFKIKKPIKLKKQS